MKQVLHNNIKEQAVVRLKKDEVQTFVIFCDGSQEQTCTIELVGEGARAKVYGLFFGKAHKQQSLSVTIRHLVPHTTSHIEIVGALKESATASITGTIEIAPGAHGSEGREEIRTLLLSKRARVRAIPELQIHNNDVHCSHAVSTTHIDEEKKFYLESRGINEDEALQVIVDGHFATVIEQIEDESLKKMIQQKILV